MKDQRVALRMTSWQKDTIERAAAVCGGSITDFALTALMGRAEEVLSDQPVFMVDQATWDEFNRVLDESPDPVPGMVDLLSRSSAFVR
jgi:uncharacterized protein (DUF1778 family)